MIVINNKIIREQLCYSLKTIAFWEFPQKWPELVDAIYYNIKNNDYNNIICGLHCLKWLIKV